MKKFITEELEMIESIRSIVGDSTLDEYECLEVYEEIIEE